MSRRSSISAVLIDLSGTVHIGSNPIRGAIEAISKLQANGIPFRFCSNTSKESTNAVKFRLRKMGIQLRDDVVSPGEEVWTSIGAVKRTLQEQEVHRPYLLLSDSAKEELGVNESKEAHRPYDAVVIGLAPDIFDYHHLNTAFRILTGEHQEDLPLTTDSLKKSDEGTRKLAIPLIATHKAKYRESSSPPGLSLGPGPFVAALEYATGLQAQVLGKPTRRFFSTVIDDLRQELPDLNADHIAVIGDDVEADLGDGAIELGLWRVLVRTGKYRPGDEHRPGIAAPDEICDSLAAFVDSIV